MTVPSKPLKELFLSALEVPADERAEWLDRECGGDVGLREQLNLMLAAHDAPHSPLDKPSMVELGATINQPITEKPGTQIAPTSCSSKSAKAAWASSTWLRPAQALICVAPKSC